MALEGALCCQCLSICLQASLPKTQVLLVTLPRYLPAKINIIFMPSVPKGLIKTGTSIIIITCKLPFNHLHVKLWVIELHCTNKKTSSEFLLQIILFLQQLNVRTAEHITCNEQLSCEIRGILSDT